MKELYTLHVSNPKTPWRFGKVLKFTSKAGRSCVSARLRKIGLSVEKGESEWCNAHPSTAEYAMRKIFGMEEATSDE